MNIFLDLVLSLATVVMVLGSRPLIVNEDPKIETIMRHGDDIYECEPREVCADLFDFIRDHGDGTGRREKRYIQNCLCPSGTQQCGTSEDQLIFRETQKQMMTTCELAEEFPVCSEDDIAKEQIKTRDGKIYYKINCVCPRNDQPSNFRNRMTEEVRRSHEDITQDNVDDRIYRCR